MKAVRGSRAIGRPLRMVNEAHKRSGQFRRSDADRRDLVTREAMTGDYDTTMRGIFAESRFDMVWWRDRATA